MRGNGERFITLNDQRIINWIKEKLHRSDGTFFTVQFLRRGDGQLRTMNGRLGVKKHANGKRPIPWNPEDHDLIRMWDRNHGYRMVNLRTVNYIAVRGKKYGELLDEKDWSL